jgi:hypothetical protein
VVLMRVMHAFIFARLTMVFFDAALPNGQVAKETAR